ncbi:Clp protease N-terminal domain-containing protein [Streptomyces sp. NBC_00984]|uniref:Clp protease N-terminal domain-containing protein n=1 Tax=Streptomyces sp. NBC_00984 TaxID=2903700 RepID=UPI00386A794F
MSAFLTKSLRIAVGRHDRLIGDEHLLLVLTACPGVVADVLAAQGAMYGTVNRALYGGGDGEEDAGQFRKAG